MLALPIACGDDDDDGGGRASGGEGGTASGGSSGNGGKGGSGGSSNESGGKGGQAGSGESGGGANGGVSGDPEGGAGGEVEGGAGGAAEGGAGGAPEEPAGEHREARRGEDLPAVSEWTVLDTRSGIGPFPERNALCVYDTATPGSFRFYRLKISANNGDILGAQLSELELYDSSNANVIGGGDACDYWDVDVSFLRRLFSREDSRGWKTPYTAAWVQFEPYLSTTRAIRSGRCSTRAIIKGRSPSA